MSEPAGFFPNGQCRHYQLVDGWAKVWCVRTDEGHTEHETANGARWAPDRRIRCDYCGAELPSVKTRSHVPTPPSLQRLGFDTDKVVCPECVEKARAAHGTDRQNGSGR